MSVGPDSEIRRNGFGSGRGLRLDWVVRLTPAGRAAAAIWRPLADEIEERWGERFGAAAVVLEDPTRMLPHYPMVLHRGGWPDGS